jgi:hypothetical protein
LSYFPGFYITLAIASLSFVILDAWLGTDEPIFDPETTGEFGRALIGAAASVPYIRISTI